jgi:hypothetical protein
MWNQQEMREEFRGKIGPTSFQLRLKETVEKQQLRNDNEQRKISNVAARYAHGAATR